MLNFWEFDVFQRENANLESFPFPDTCSFFPCYQLAVIFINRTIMVEKPPKNSTTKMMGESVSVIRKEEKNHWSAMPPPSRLGPLGRASSVENKVACMAVFQNSNFGVTLPQF